MEQANDLKKGPLPRPLEYRLNINDRDLPLGFQRQLEITIDECEMPPSLLPLHHSEERPPYQHNSRPALALRNTPKVPATNYSVDIHHSLYHSTSVVVSGWGSHALMLWAVALRIHSLEMDAE
ncbi:hypothetical protein CEXT_441941 [Caerostris extrusa]|uniref:Uncharacterized protein n=1 Tax=Caerostris extrusa TaxID=172846 RepID=A0AAV4Y1P4_CAEEX|nr:hypothetical protein CEXT_441941 [Caerostris extrusa]